MTKTLAPEEPQDDLAIIEPAEKIPVPDAKDEKALDELVQNMPEVVSDAVAAAEGKEAEAQAAQKAAIDKKGRPFNPDLHQADAQGNPLYTPTGQFRKKLKMPGQGTSRGGAGIQMPPDAAPQMDMMIKAEAIRWADTFIIAGQSIVGDEWKPEQGEREGLISANEQVFLRYGVVQVHPLANMGLIYGLYIVKRVITKPKTKSIFQAGVEKTKVFFTNIWLKVTGQKIKIVPDK